MANLTAVTGNWSTTAASNTAFGGASTTTAADEITIPNGVTVTILTANNVLARSVTVASGGALAFASTTAQVSIGDATAGTSNVALSISSGATITLTGIGTINFVSTNATQQTIATGGKTVPNITINGAGSSYLASDAMTSTGTFTLSAGTYGTGSFTHTCLGFVSTGTGTRVLNAGTSNFSITSTAAATVWNVTGSNFTISPSNSTITIANSSANTRTMTFTSGIYGTIVYKVAGSSGQLALGAASYIATLDMDISSTGTARTLNFPTGSSFTMGTLNLKGSSGNVVSVKTSTGGTAVTVALLGAVSTMDWLDVRDINSTMPYKFYAGVNSVSTGGGNTNVLLADKVSQPAIWNAANSAGSGTSITSTLPASLTATAGNVLLAVWTASTTSVSGMTGPTGYTLIDNNTAASAPQTYMWYKVAAGGETAATVTTSSSHASVALSLMEIGSFTGTPTLDVFAHTDAGASVTSQASASVTNTAQPAIAVAGFAASGSTGALVSTTNNWQEQRITQLSIPRYFALPLTSTGAQTTTYTWTTSRTSANVATIFKDVASAATDTGNFFLMF